MITICDNHKYLKSLDIYDSDPVYLGARVSAPVAADQLSAGVSLSRAAGAPRAASSLTQHLLHEFCRAKVWRSSKRIRRAEWPRAFAVGLVHEATMLAIECVPAMHEALVVPH